MIHLIALIFPFSMTPGGVHTSSDWQQHRSDSAYRICRIAGTLRPAQVRKPIQRYVSFSRDGVALWTDHLLTIAAREDVMVSGGDIVLRGRCGNCVQTEAPPARLRVPFTPPEPGTWALFLGDIAIVLCRKKKRLTNGK